MLGSFGVLLGTAQLLLMEIDTLRRVTWTVEIIGFIAGFIFCLNFMYTRASLFLKDCDAALLNLSLLTSDVYAVLFSYFYYGYLVSWLYFLAFGLACTGLAIYSAAPPPTGLSTPRCGEGPDQAHAVDDQSSPFEEEDSASEPQPPFQASYYSVPHSDDQESAF